MLLPYHTIPYHTLPYHTIPYCTILFYTILYYTIPHQTILYYTTPYCNILHHTILYYTTLHHTVIYYTILYHTILYFTLLFYTSASSDAAMASCSPLIFSATSKSANVLGYGMLESEDDFFLLLKLIPVGPARVSDAPPKQTRTPRAEKQAEQLHKCEL